MPNATESQIKARIADFVQELELTVRKNTLEALKDALKGRAAPARRGRPAGSGRGPGRPKGSGRGGNLDEAAAKIVAHVRSNDGQGISAIAAATGLALPVAKKAAVRLLAEGGLKKSGQKRGTVYHVGSGRAAPARARKAGKRRARKTKRGARKATKVKKKAKKPSRKPRAVPRRKVRSAKRAVVIPARRLAPAPKTVMADTDVPQALAVG